MIKYFYLLVMTLTTIISGAHVTTLQKYFHIIKILHSYVEIQSCSI